MGGREQPARARPRARAARERSEGEREARPERPVSEANKSGSLVEVTYVFGSRLPKHGRCVTTRAEIQRLQHRVSVSTGYVVEVCTVCGWNHLVRRFTLGGRRSA